MMPSANTIVRAISRCWDICNRQIMGIGRVITARSTMRLMIPSARKEATLSPQVPGRLGFQFLANGLQIKKAWRVAPKPKEITRAITMYTALRKVVFKPNMVL